jgi:hypothetical protein
MTQNTVCNLLSDIWLTIGIFKDISSTNELPDIKDTISVWTAKN